MKKIIFGIMFLLIGTMLFSQQLPIFLFVEVSNDVWATELLVNLLGESLSSSGNFTPGTLDNPETVELLVRAFPVIIDGEELFYAISVGVVFHNSDLVRFSDITVLAANPNRDGLEWASKNIYNFLWQKLETASQ